MRPVPPRATWSHAASASAATAAAVDSFRLHRLHRLHHRLLQSRAHRGSPGIPSIVLASHRARMNGGETRRCAERASAKHATPANVPRHQLRHGRLPLRLRRPARRALGATMTTRRAPTSAISRNAIGTAISASAKRATSALWRPRWPTASRQILPRQNSKQPPPSPPPSLPPSLPPPRPHRKLPRPIARSNTHNTAKPSGLASLSTRSSSVFDTYLIPRTRFDPRGNTMAAEELWAAPQGSSSRMSRTAPPACLRVMGAHRLACGEANTCICES